MSTSDKTGEAMPYPQEVINYLNECVEAQGGAWPLTKVAISASVVDDIIRLLAPSAERLSDEQIERVWPTPVATPSSARSQEPDVDAFLQHAEALGLMSDQALADEVKRGGSVVVEKYIAGLKWSEHATEDEKALVAGNLRTFWTWLHINSRGRIKSALSASEPTCPGWHRTTQAEYCEICGGTLARSDSAGA